MKKVMKAAFVVAIAAVAGYNIYTNLKSNTVSDLVLANVEALANDENSEKGTLYGNAEGTRYCCCSGTRTCGAATCSNC
ncbi:MAG: hypothetical protein K2L60_10730 [Bacteroides sp.]|nr:hypothetical protein [Bacteroides sp.]